MQASDYFDLVALGASLASSACAFALMSTFLRPVNPCVAYRPIKKWWSLKHLLLQNEAELMESTEAGGDHYAFYENLAKSFDYAPVTHSLSFMQVLMVSHPADLEHVLATNVLNYPKDFGYKSILGRALGQGLVTILDPAKHSKQRRIVSPAFQPATLRRIANEIVRTHGAEMIKKLRADIAASSSSSSTGCLSARKFAQDVTMRATLDVIVEAAFHTENWEQLEAIASRARFVVDNVFSPMYLFSVIAMLSPTLKKVDRARKEVHQLLTQITDKLKQNPEDLVQHGTSRAIVDTLLTTNELTMDEMLDHSLTFMFAGFETTNTSLQWTLALLASHPAVQNRLFEELACVMGLNSCAELEELTQCRYLDAVIRESLRLYPVAAIVGREAVSDDILPRSRTYVRKGQVVLLNVYNAHRNPETYGPTCNDFVPERWLDGTLQVKCGTAGYMPFIIGPRNCIGKDFAWNEMTILLSMLVRNFGVSFPADVQFPRRIRQITMVPSRFELLFEARVQ